MKRNIRRGSKSPESRTVDAVIARNGRLIVQRKRRQAEQRAEGRR